MVKAKAADDHKLFAEGFVTGWQSLLGPASLPTVIPECEIPIDQSPFTYGYEQSRAFATATQENEAATDGRSEE
jgi:hypothetical protein